METRKEVIKAIQELIDLSNDGAVNIKITLEFSFEKKSASEIERLQNGTT